MYNWYMSRQMAISEVRRRLPSLVEEVQREGTVEITNRGVTVASLVGPATDAVGTAETLLALRRKLGRRLGARVDVSTRKSEHLTRRHD